MTYKFVAVEGATIEPSEDFTSGTVDVISSPSTKSFLESKAVYRGSLSISISGAQLKSGPVVVCQQTAPTVPGSISPSTIKTSSDGENVIREGDNGATVQIVGKHPVSNADCLIPFTPTVTDAGQETWESQ